MKFAREGRAYPEPLGEKYVVERLEAWLRGLGFDDIRKPDTHKGRGIDLFARNPRTGEEFAIEAKGSTKDDSRVAASAIANAFLVAVDWLGRENWNVEARKAIAIPDSFWFDAHLARAWMLTNEFPITVFRVPKDGECAIAIVQRPQVVDWRKGKKRRASNIAISVSRSGDDYVARVPGHPSYEATGKTLVEVEAKIGEAVRSEANRLGMDLPALDPQFP